MGKIENSSNFALVAKWIALFLINVYLYQLMDLFKSMMHYMEYRKEKIILNGKIKLITQLTEFRMALWINSFGLEDAATGEEIIPLISFFNLDQLEEKGDTLKIKIRIYPNGSEEYDIAINPFSRYSTFKNQEYNTTHFYQIIMGEE